MTEELEERLWAPLWGGEAAQDQAVGFFSPKHEAYRPLGKLAAVKPLLSTLSQRFPSTLRSFSRVLSPTTAVSPLSLKPETRHRSRFAFPMRKQRDIAAKTLKLEIRRSDQRVLGVKSGFGLLKTLQNRTDVRKILFSKPQSRLSMAPDSLSVLQQERNRSLEEKLCFYDESRTSQAARSYQRRLKTQHLPWEQAETVSVPQSPDREMDWKEGSFRGKCIQIGEKYGFSQSAQSSPQHSQLYGQSCSSIVEENRVEPTTNSTRRRGAAKEQPGSMGKAGSNPVSPRVREISKLLADSRRRKGRLRGLISLYFASPA